MEKSERRAIGKGTNERPATPPAAPAALHSGTWVAGALCGTGTAIPAEVTMRHPRSEVRAVRRMARRAEGPGGEPRGGRRRPRQPRQRCTPGTPALGRLVLSAALERRFRPRLLCDIHDPRCAPCGAWHAAPRSRAAILGAAGGARGSRGSAALRHLGGDGRLAA